jgi:hypothetical protein
MQKNHDIKAEVFEEKVKFLEQCKEAEKTGARRMEEWKDRLEETVRNIQKETKRNVQELSERIEGVESSSISTGRNSELTKLHNQLAKQGDSIR